MRRFNKFETIDFMSSEEAGEKKNTGESPRKEVSHTIFNNF